MTDFRAIAQALEDPRQTGKTTAICSAAKSIDATVLTHCQQEAARLQREHEVPALSIEAVYNLRGARHPVLIDNYAVAHIIHKMGSEIEHWKKQATLKQQIIETIRNVLP